MYHRPHLNVYAIKIDSLKTKELLRLKAKKHKERKQQEYAGATLKDIDL